MTEIVTRDDGVFRSVIRPIRSDETARIGQVLATLRDESTDKIPAEYEALHWQARTNTCLANGAAWCVTTNNGAPWGAVLVERDAMVPGRAVLVAHDVQADTYEIGGPDIRGALLACATDWCAEQGLTLGRFVQVLRTEWRAV